jgi:transposase
VAGRDWRARERSDDVSRPTARRLDAQKKSLIATERNEDARTVWRTETAQLIPQELLFLDETCTHTGLTRLRSRAPRGQRARGTAPRNHDPNVTLLAVLGPTGIVTALAIPGAATSAVFVRFVDRFLAPLLRPGQTVILDNLSVHKNATARARIEAVGASLRFLPPYSPDLNPIEAVFAKVKTALRAAAARSPEELLAATKAALDAITPHDAAGCYAACGYRLTSPDAS